MQNIYSSKLSKIFTFISQNRLPSTLQKSNQLFRSFFFLLRILFLTTIYEDEGDAQRRVRHYLTKND